MNSQNPRSLFVYALGITVPVGILILGLCWFVASHILQGIVKEELHDQVAERSAREASRIQKQFDNLKHFAKTLAGNGLIINGIIDLEGRSDYLPIFFRSLTLPGSSAGTAFLVDYRGRPIISSSADQTESPPQISNGLNEALIFDQNKIIIVQPVLINASIEGAILLHYPASTFETLFDTSSIQHSFYLVNQYGNVGYSTDMTLAKTGQPEPAEQENGWLQIRSALSHAQLSIVVGSRLDVAFKTLDTVQLVLVVGLVILLGIALGLLVLSIFIVSKPLKEISQGISAIHSTADLDRPLDVKGPREIIDIALTFNRMAKWLQSTSVSRDHMDGILESITEGIVTIDQHGKISSGNKAIKNIFGYDENQLVGRRLSILFPDKKQLFDNKLLKAPDSAGEVLAFEGLRADGTRFPMDFVVSSLISAGNSGYVCTMRDTTERKEIELSLAKQTLELQRTNNELEKFVYVASHDLKAPMRGIDNLVTWIEEDLDDTIEDDVRENMSLLRNRVYRMECLLDGLLEYSRVGREKFQAESVDSALLVKSIVDFLSVPEGFEVIIDPDMPILLTEKVSLEQVFRNLINNAIKHHDQPTGKIEVSGKAVTDAFEFTVADDGAGIAEEFQSQIFIMFQTLKSRDQVEGSGMGLALVKKEVELHGGEVKIVSDEGKRGASFIFSWKDSALLSNVNG